MNDCFQIRYNAVIGVYRRTLNKIEKVSQEKGEARVVAFASDEKRLIANWVMHIGKRYLNKVYFITSELNHGANSKNEVKAVKHDKDKIVIAVHGDSEGINKITETINSYISDSIGEIGNDDELMQVVELEIKDDIVNVVSRAYDTALNNGIDSVRNALENNKEEGNKEQISAALNKLRNVADNIWIDFLIE